MSTRRDADAGERVAGFAASFDLELLDDMVDLDRMDGDAQRSGDLLVGLVAVHLLGDLQFPRSQAVERLRLFFAAGRLARGGRRLWLLLAATWPWAAQLTAAITRLQAFAPG